LNFIHERTVTIAIGNNNTWFISKSIGDNDVSNFLEEQFFGITNKGLILFSKELELLPLSLIIIRHLEIALADINNILK